MSMDENLKNMDKISVQMNAMADWISREAKPPLIFAALSRSRSRNNPYPLVGVVYQAEGEYEWWEQGGVRFRLPWNHFKIGYSHRGASTSEPKPGTAFWSCAFDASSAPIFAKFAEEPPADPVPIRNPARLCRAYQEVATQFLMRRPTTGLKLKAALLDWFAVLLDELDGRSAGGNSALPLSVEKAVEFMHHNIGNSAVDLEAVARASGLSVQHFGRIFTGSMKQSPIAYLRHIRVEHAKNLLRETSLRVSEVAHDSGFEDPLHFSRVFRIAAGRSPRAFREDGR